MELVDNYNFRNLNKIIINENYKNVLIIGGNKSYYSSNANKIIQKLTVNKKKILYLKKKKLPEISELMILIKKIKKHKPNLILAIGGGAVLDLSKIANTMFDVNNIKQKIIKNNYQIKKRFCDIIAIPTTAGTGAEVTTNAVLYIDKKKYSIEHNLIKPNNMALFPELVINNKKINVITSSAFDCFAQSVESMFSVKSTAKSLEYSKKSIEIFTENYENFLKNKTRKKAYLLSLAAYYSGKAISISKTIAPHAVSYPFTSHFNINHGHAVSLTFNNFLQHNYLNLQKSTAKYNLNERYTFLFKLLKVRNINELIFKIDQIRSNLSLEKKLSIINKKIPSSLDLILKNVNVQRLTNNPVLIEKKDIYNIFKEII